MFASSSFPTSHTIRVCIAIASWSLLAARSPAQSRVDWWRAHDGPLGGFDAANACAVDAAGNVYAAGLSDDPSPAQSDIELVKYSSTGVELWSVHHDVNGQSDAAQDCQVSAQGDVYVCGYAVHASGSGYDAVLLKYTSSGALDWTRFLPGTGDDSAYLIAFDAAGNVLVGGSSSHGYPNYDVLLASYTPAGVLNWSTSIDGSANDWDVPTQIRGLQSGDIAVAGRTTNTGTGSDFTVWKFTANGALLWTATLDGGASSLDLAAGIVEAPGAKLIASGGGTVDGTDLDVMVVELDSASGAVGWTRFYDGASGLDDSASHVALDASGVLWLGCSEYNPVTRYDVVVRRLALDGSLLSTAGWDNNGAVGSEWPSAMFLGTASQAWICGYSPYGVGAANEDAFVAQFDSSGALNWATRYSSPGVFQDRPIDMALAPGDRIAMAGGTAGGSSGTFDALALQIDLSESPQAYCTAKTTSNGCVPSTTFEGMPSASAVSGFSVRASNLRNHKSGLLFYGVGGALANPFQGGTMCVAAPTVRTAVQSSGGSALPADDCSGSFALDMNAYAAGALGGAPLPALQIVGTAVCCQFWGRDPGFAPPQSTMLSNALRYVVLP